MKPVVIEEKPLSMVEARKELKKIAKRDEELSHRANKTEEYLGQLTKLSEKASKELREGLVGLEIPRLREEHIVKLVDLLPYTKEDVKMILSAYAVTIKEENIKKILDVISEYRK